jgi:hypothetical protein
MSSKFAIVFSDSVPQCLSGLNSEEFNHKGTQAQSKQTETDCKFAISNCPSAHHNAIHENCAFLAIFFSFFVTFVAFCKIPLVAVPEFTCRAVASEQRGMSSKFAIVFSTSVPQCLSGLNSET